jgi:hypothetical protein
VTSITINYQLNSCAIARTLSGLALPIEPPAVTTGRPLPNFSYGSPAILQQPPNTIVIDATFLPAGSFLVNEDTASGGVSFHDYMGCGSGGFSFSARRR